MISKTKIYHRGNDDAAEASYLTAIFTIVLKADEARCQQRPPDCLGEVPIALSIDIKSPDGAGNGYDRAAQWVGKYGIEMEDKTFELFTNATPDEATPEEWKITKSTSFGPIPCKGGERGGVVTIRMNPKEPGNTKYKGIAYQVVWLAKVEFCGKVTLLDFILKEGPKAFALDEGPKGLARGSRTLVHVTPGMDAPFGTKSSPSPDGKKVSDTGEVVPK